MRLCDKNESLIGLDNIAYVECAVEDDAWLLTILWCAMDCCRHFEYSNEDLCKKDYNTIDLWLCKKEK